MVAESHGPSTVLLPLQPSLPKKERRKGKVLTMVILALLFKFVSITSYLFSG